MHDRKVLCLWTASLFILLFYQVITAFPPLLYKTKQILKENVQENKIFLTNLNVRCSNLWVLLISSSNKYIPKYWPPLKEKTSRGVNSCNPCSKNVNKLKWLKRDEEKKISQKWTRLCIPTSCSNILTNRIRWYFPFSLKSLRRSL